MEKPIKRNKVNSGLRLNPDIVDKAKALAQSSGQTETWIIENILAIALGLPGWPKQPKGIGKAKEFAKRCED